MFLSLPDRGASVLGLFIIFVRLRTVVALWLGWVLRFDDIVKLLSITQIS